MCAAGAGDFRCNALGTLVLYVCVQLVLTVGCMLFWGHDCYMRVCCLCYRLDVRCLVGMIVICVYAAGANCWMYVVWGHDCYMRVRCWC
jgi:hypothetical protein